MDWPCQDYIGEGHGAAQNWIWRPRVFRQGSLFETRHFESERFRRRCFRRAPINAERLPVHQLRPRRRPCESSENQMAQLAIPAIIADAGTAAVWIARSRQAPFRYAAVVQARDPGPGIVPSHLTIGRVPGSPRIIGVLKPRQIALDIVEQPAPAIDQQWPKENPTGSAPDEEPVEKRRPPHRDQFQQPFHRLTDGFAPVVSVLIRSLPLTHPAGFVHVARLPPAPFHLIFSTLITRVPAVAPATSLHHCLPVRLPPPGSWKHREKVGRRKDDQACRAYRNLYRS